MKYSNITIAGKICTGKSTLRRKLREKLGWESFSTGQMFRDYAKEHELSLDIGEEQDKIAEQIDNMVHSRLKHEHNLIVDSWMAGVKAKDIPNVLKVLLICSHNKQVDRYVKRENVPQKKAKDLIRSRETVFDDLARRYKTDDILNPKHYNIVIDTTSTPVSEVVEQVLNKLNA